MKYCVWAGAVALMLFLGWQIGSSRSQDADDAVATPSVETAAPAADPAAEIPAVAETPAAAKPVEPVAAPAAAPVVAKPAETMPAETKAEPFYIDRTPQSVPAPSVGAPLSPGRSAPAEPGAAPAVAQFEENGSPKAESKGSFWGRLFGTSKDKDKAPAAQPSESAGALPISLGIGTAPAAQVEKKQETQEEILAAQEEVRRQSMEIEGLKYLDLAYQAMSRNEFDDALKLFNQAMSIMPMRPYTVETRNKARMAQAQCEYRLALKSYQQGILEEGRRHANLALGYVPNHKEAQRLSERIDRDIAKVVPKPRSTRPTPIRFSPEHLDKEKRMSGAISRGRQYMAVHEYEKAAFEFKTVILEDKGNEEANANLKKIAEKGYQLETDQYERMQVEMMTQVRDTWTPAVKKDVSQPLRPIDPTGVISPEKQRLMTKLNTIIIPQLDFRQANIVDVIKYLDQATIVADESSPAGEKGVNIILNLKRPGQMGTGATGAVAPVGGGEDLFTTEGPAGAAAASANIPTVTLTLRNIVLLDAIKFITEVTGLKFRVEANVVIITPADVVVGEVLTRTYRVQPNIGDIIGGAMSAGAAGGAMGGIGVELIAGGGAAAGQSGDVKKFFIDAGVPFPDGTSIKYQSSLNLLIVANTAENLEKFEQILSKLNVIPIQVEIEARFVEVSQTDLEELGIEWLLTDNWEIAQDASAAAAVPLSARKRVQVNQNSFTKGLRELDNSSGALSAIPGGNMAGIFSLSSVLTNPELSFILHALEQRDGANLLSAPKVTTKTGANAEIKVVREIIYPTAFDQSTQTAGQPGGVINAQLTQIVVTPSGFQTRDTGVILNVTPVVGPDGFTIDLTMMPQVVELAEWLDYGSTIIDPGGVQRRIPMPQPIFLSRSIATSISIWDGQTVVMGGLITEQQSTTVDKIPFLGDIPLVGYLFQSKTSKSVKRNLLIFVTANLVDPAGNKINKTPVDMVGAAVSSGASKAAP